MTTPEQAFERYVALWSVTDEAALRELADQTLTEDVAIVYPTFEAHGRANVVAAAVRFHQDNPGVQFVLTSGVERHHGWIRGAWRMTLAGGSTARDGQTIIELADDGRLRRAIGFLDPLPARP